MPRDVIIGLDAGTSVAKAIAFDLDGVQLADAAIANEYTRHPTGGAVEQEMAATWTRAADTIRNLLDAHAGLSHRVLALAVTGQGDGTWLVDDDGQPVAPAWLWLDARAAPIVEAMQASGARTAAYRYTGCGMNASNQSGQLAWLAEHSRSTLDRASTAMHCKDWLYLNLTGMRVTDFSEGCFTYGDFRRREYADEVLDALALTEWRHLLPPMVDGGATTHPLTEAASKQTGLPAGIPVSLGYVDVLCCALGAGLYAPEERVALSIVGSTGMHMTVTPTAQVALGDEPSGYTMPFMVPGQTARMQSNMAATLNIDWLVGLGLDAARLSGADADRGAMLRALDAAAADATPAAAIYHPYIDRAGERGPFFDATARAQFFGLSNAAGLPEMMRAVYEGLGLAARDCFSAMGAGAMPEVSEVRIAGGAARSATIAKVLSCVLGTPVRESNREEAGAAGAAMMAAVATGIFDSYDAACAAWVEPTLGARVEPDARLETLYDQMYTTYLKLREDAPPHWRRLAAARTAAGLST